MNTLCFSRILGNCFLMFVKLMISRVMMIFHCDKYPVFSASPKTKHVKLSYVLFILVAIPLCNVATAAVTVDSSYGFTNANYPASKTVNGIWGTADMAQISVSNAWVIYDLGINPQIISKFRITAPRYGGTPPSTFNPQSGTIEFSDDKSTWTTAISWTMPALESVLRTDFAEVALPDPMQKRYVRLILSAWSRIAEIFFIESPQLAVWKMAQDTTSTNSYPALNTCDGDPRTYGAGIGSEGSIVYDQGKSKNIYGFRITSCFAAGSLNPTSGELYVSDSPTSGWSDMGTWTLPAMTHGATGTVLFTTPQSKRYIKLTQSSGGSQWAEFEVLNYPVVLNDTANMAIVVPNSVSITSPDTFVYTDGAVLFAAKELRYHVRKATDGYVSLGIYNESSKPSGVQYIYLGNCSATAAAGISASGLTYSKCIVRCEDGNLYICGDDTINNCSGHTLGDTSSPHYLMNNLNHLGTLLGVYDLLRTKLDIRWLWPGTTGEQVPKVSSIILPTIRKTVTPAFIFSRMRDAGSYIYNSGQYLGWPSQATFDAFMDAQQQWLRRQGFIQNVYMDMGHSYTTWWSTYGASHPEWFNLLPDGTRTYDYGSRDGSHISMCLSNSQMQSQKVDNWHASRSSYPWLNGSENDTDQKCMCTSCLVRDYYDPSFDTNMSQTDWNNRVINATNAFYGHEANWELKMGSMSDRLAQYLKELQNTAINNYGTAPEMVVGMAYANYTRPPVASIQLNDHILIGFVPAMMFPWTTALRNQMLDEISGWRNTGALIGLRPNYLYSGHNYPIFYADKYGDDITSLYTTGQGLYSTDFDSLTGQFGSQALNLYMIGRMNTNVGPLTQDMVCEEFYESFGPAKDTIRNYFAYLKTVSDGITDTSYAWGDFFNQAYVNWNVTVRINMRTNMDAAIAAASGDADTTAKVGFLNNGLLHAEKTLLVVEAWHNWVAGTQVDPDASDGFNTLIADLDNFRIARATDNSFISNYYFLRQLEDVLWNPQHRTATYNYKVLPFWFPVTGTGSGTNKIGVLYDDNLFPMPGKPDHFRITNISDNDLYIVLTLNTNSNVDQIRYTNRTDKATNYNVRDCEIYVMPTETDSNRYNVSAYTQQVFNSRLYPDSNSAGAVRSADIINVNRRYFLIKVKSNFFGTTTTKNVNVDRSLFDGHDFDVVLY